MKDKKRILAMILVWVLLTGCLSGLAEGLVPAPAAALAVGEELFAPLDDAVAELDAFDLPDDAVAGLDAFDLPDDAMAGLDAFDLPSDEDGGLEVYDLSDDGAISADAAADADIDGDAAADEAVDSDANGTVDDSADDPDTGIINGIADPDADADGKVDAEADADAVVTADPEADPDADAGEDAEADAGIDSDPAATLTATLEDADAAPDGTATLAVSATYTGAGALTYAWQRLDESAEGAEWEDLPGETADTLFIEDADAAQGVLFRCAVTDGALTAITDPARVWPALPALAAGDAPTIVKSGTCGANLTWTLDSEGTLTISGTGRMDDYTATNGVANIPWGTGIKSIVIGEGVTYIGERAFYNCTGLTHVVIPDNVTEMGRNVFYYCSGLTDVVLPSNLTSIETSLFYGCNNLNGVRIPDSVTSISYYAFRDCASLTSITIPDGVTFIGDSAFSNCSALTNVSIADSVSRIEQSAFQGCTSLKTITLPENTTGLAYHMLDGCTSLTSVTLGKNTTTIETGVFSGCTNLKSIYNMDNVKSLGSSCFYQCPSDMKKFASIGSVGATTVKYFYDPLYPKMKLWTDGTGTLSISDVDSDEDTFVIPSKVTSIESRAFGYKTHIKKVTFEEGCTGIPTKAFSYCTGLKEVIFPDTITVIGKNAFEGCSELTIVARLGSASAEAISEFGLTYHDPAYPKFELKYSGIYSVDDDVIVLSVPPKIDRVYGNVFENNKQITSVEFEEGTTSIPGAVFYDCKGLTSITLPDSVISISSYAFYNCSGLTSITIPDGVTSIGNYAFYNCPATLFAHFGSDGAKAINNYGKAFQDPGYPGLNLEHTTLSSVDKTLTMVTVPEGITTIGGEAFKDCTNLTSVTLPDGVTSIDKSAFSGCTGLTSVTLPDGVTSIGSYAFYDCSGLAGMTIPDKVTSIGSYTYSGCSGLTSMEIPDGVTSIGSYAFYNCSGLTSVEISDSVKSIGSYAFSGCSKLMGVEIPDSVTSIGSNAFYNCSGLTSVEISDSVKSIGSSAFSGCSSLTSVTIPDSVTSIDNYAFSNCSCLTSMEIPDSVKSIGSYVFSGCSKLISVTIPDSVTSIGSYAFSGCKALADIVVPDSVTSIGGNAFSNCVELTSVSVPVQAKIESTAFSGCSILRKVTLTGSDAMEDYASSSSTSSSARKSPWGSSVKEVVIGDGVTKVGSYAFYSCTGLESLTLPVSASVASTAFYKTSTLVDLTLTGSGAMTDYASGSAPWGTGVRKVMIGNGVTSVGSNAFRGCTALTDVTMPESVKSISSYAFYGCKALAELALPEGVTSVGNYAFSGCTGLTGVTIPEGVQTIGSSAFSGCTGLAEIALPDSVTSVGSYAFSGCTGLEAATLGGGVTTLGESVFANCAALNRVDLSDSPVSIGKNAFNGCSGLTRVDGADNVTAIDATAFTGAYPTFYAAIGSTGARTISNRGRTFRDPAAPNMTLQYSGSDLVLTSVDADAVTAAVPEGVTKIGANAFSKCTDLKEVILPDTVKAIDSSAFGSITPSFYASIGSEDAKLLSKQGKTFRDPSAPMLELQYQSSTLRLVAADADIEIAVIPDGVKEIASEAFKGRAKLSSVSIPNSVTSIGSGAFQNCTALTAVAIPTSVTRINENTFNGCAALQSVTLPDGLSRIDDGAFVGCNAITEMKIPKATALSFYGCALAGRVTVYAYSPAREHCDKYSVAYDIIAALSVSVAPAVVELDIDDTQKLTVRYAPEAAKPNITYVSSDQSVATVGSDGNVTGVGYGKAIITVLVDDVKATCQVNVGKAPTSITLSAPRTELGLGEQVQTTYALNKGAASRITYLSKNTACVTVDEYGMVTAVGLGTAIVRAVTENGKTSELMFKVTDPPTGIELDQSDAELKLGGTLQLKASVIGGSSSVTFETDDPDVATVDGAGLVRATGGGYATITASTYNGKVAECVVMVREVRLTLASTQFAVGDALALKAEYLPEAEAEAEGITLTVKTSSAKIVKVAATEDGWTLKAVKAGKATITVTASDGLSAKVKLVVKKKAKKGTLVLPALAGVGETFELRAKSNTCGYASIVEVQTRNNDDVIAVEDGFVNALKTGTAELRARLYNGKWTPWAKVTVKAAPSNGNMAFALSYDRGKGWYDPGDFPVDKIITVAKGDYANMKLVYDEGFGGTYAIYSTESSVLAISGSRIRFAGQGVASVVCEAYNGARTSLTFEVVPAPKKAYLEDSGAITKGFWGEVTWEYDSYNYDYMHETISSSKKGVASVDAFGEVKGKKVGKAKITVKAFNGAKGSCTVKVVKNKVTVASKPSKAYIQELWEDDTYDIYLKSAEVINKNKIVAEYYFVNGLGYTVKRLIGGWEAYLDGGDFFETKYFKTMKINCKKKSYKTFKVTFTGKGIGDIDLRDFELSGSCDPYEGEDD